MLYTTFKRLALVASLSMLWGCASIDNFNNSVKNSFSSYNQYSSHDIGMSYNQPPAALKEKMKMIYPAFDSWQQNVQQQFAGRGMPLSGDDLAWANTLGITGVQNIRIIESDYFPMPNSGFLIDELERLNWGSPYEDARNMGYSIFIRAKSNTPQQRAKQLALIHIMEKMGDSRFNYRRLIEQRMIADIKDQPIEKMAAQLQQCKRNALGKLSVSCYIFGMKPMADISNKSENLNNQTQVINTLGTFDNTTGKLNQNLGLDALAVDEELLESFDSNMNKIKNARPIAPINDAYQQLTPIIVKPK